MVITPRIIVCSVCAVCCDIYWREISSVAAVEAEALIMLAPHTSAKADATEASVTLAAGGSLADAAEAAVTLAAGEIVSEDESPDRPAST